MRGRLLVLIVVVLATACSADDGPDVTRAPAGTPPPASAVLVDGDWGDVAAWVRAQAAEGRPSVVNVFASWCAPCRRELPLLIATAQDHPEIAFLGVDHLDNRPAGEETVARYGIPYPTVYDPAGDVAAGLQGRGMPTTAFFDSDGRLVERHTGELTDDHLAELVDRLTADT